MAGIYRAIQRHTREVISYRPGEVVGAPSATFSNGSLCLGDFEASGFFRCFILEDQIGQTRCGKLFTAKIRDAPNWSTPCRVERVRRWGLRAESKAALFEEVRILRSLDHPNVVDVHLFFRDDPKYYYLVLEHLKGPELFDYVSAKEHYLESDARRECLVLLSAIKYLHDQDIVHRNITPESILLADPEDDSSMKIVDFSWARSVRAGGVTTKGGNPYFLAPEIINGNSHGKAVDMWNLGIIMYILLAADHPFYHWDTRIMFKRVKSGSLMFSERVWTYISDDAKNFIRGLLKVDPNERMTVSSALDHPWFFNQAKSSTASSGPSKKAFLLYNARRKLRATVVAITAARALWSLIPEDRFDSVYDMGCRIGRGAFGEVFEATLRFPREGQPTKYAVKRANRVGISPTADKSMRNEAEILQSLDHPNIVEFNGFFDNNPRYFYLVMELMEGGELYGRISKKRKYNEEEARDLCRILLGAMKYMHDQDVMHRDLKPQNLLLASKTDDTTIRIADFGFSCSVRDGPVRDSMGTPRYVAPEIINGRAYGTSVDMWAIGVIVYQLLCGTFPFNHSTQTHLFTLIKRGEFDFDSEPWAGVSGKAKDIIRGLLKVDPQQRLTATDAISHPWLIADGADLSNHDLSPTLYSLRLFNAKRKLRSSVQQVVAMRTIISSGRNNSNAF